MKDRTEATNPQVERPFLAMLRATLFGGLIFLLPLGLIGYLVGKAVGLAVVAGEPVFRMLPHTALWLAMVPILALLGLLFLALVAGLFAKTATGKKFLNWVEATIFGGVPQYQMMKSMAEGVARMESGPGWEPVLTECGSGWRLGFIVEAVNDEWAAVFLPQSPSVTVGAVVYLPVADLRPVGMTMAQASAILKRMGVGSAEALPNVDLTMPLRR